MPSKPRSFYFLQILRRHVMVCLPTTPHHLGTQLIRFHSFHSRYFKVLLPSSSALKLPVRRASQQKSLQLKQSTE